VHYLYARNVVEKQTVDMSEWLRRQTRNLLGFACAGSNPAVDVIFFSVFFPLFASSGQPGRRGSVKIRFFPLFASSGQPGRRGSVKNHGEEKMITNEKGSIY
jgi:hypothetical protein